MARSDVVRGHFSGSPSTLDQGTGYFGDPTVGASGSFSIRN